MAGKRKTAVLVCLDETHGFVHDAVGGFGIVLRLGHGLLVRRIKELPLVSGQARSEPLRIGRERTSAQVPFPRKEVRVAGLAQGLSDGDFLKRKVVLVRRGEQFAGPVAPR